MHRISAATSAAPCSSTSLMHWGTSECVDSACDLLPHAFASHDIFLSEAAKDMAVMGIRMSEFALKMWALVMILLGHFR